MAIFVKLFGIAIVCMGVIFLIKPKETFKQYILFWKQGKRLRIGGVLAILLGIVFLAAASQCNLAWLIAVLGAWSIIKGVLLFALGQKKIYAYLDWWLEKPVSVTRFIALFALALGVLIIYSV